MPAEPYRPKAQVTGKRLVGLIPMLSMLFVCACQSDAGKDEDTGERSVSGRVTEGRSGTIDSTHRVRYTIYVPIYSHINSRDGKRSIDLAATLSIRNTDAAKEMTIAMVRYYDSEGNLVRTFLEEARRVEPLASAEFLVEEDDMSGGSGASFIVELAAPKEATEPVVEAVMIGTASAQGISFTSPGRLIAKETGE